MSIFFSGQTTVSAALGVSDVRALQLAGIMDEIFDSVIPFVESIYLQKVFTITQDAHELRLVAYYAGCCVTEAKRQNLSTVYVEAREPVLVV